MTIEGTWELTIATVAGKQHATLEVTRDGDRVSGVAKANGEEMAMENLVLDDSRATWTVAMTKPFKLNLAFDVTVEGDEMTGHSNAGRFPRSKVTGRRIES